MAAINPKEITGKTKPQLHLIPPSAAILEALVMEHGASKYGPWNWRHSDVVASTYISAAQRHIAQFMDGCNLDQDTGLPHLAHARASLGILLDAMEFGRLIDDRPPIPCEEGGRGATELIAEHTRGIGSGCSWIA